MGEVYFKHRERIEQAFIKLPHVWVVGETKNNYIRGKSIYNNSKGKHYKTVKCRKRVKKK